MALEEATSKSKPRAKAPTKSRTRGRATTTKSKVATLASATAIVAGECSALLKQKGNVLRLKAHNLSMQRKCDQAEALLEEAAKLPVGHQEAVVHGLTEARHLFLEALALISSDPVFSVLQDSSMSHSYSHPPFLRVINIWFLSDFFAQYRDGKIRDPEPSYFAC